MTRNLIQDVVDAIANGKGVENTELDLVLDEHMDGDVLCQLADRDNSTWTLSFELPEHTVTVMSDGAILVDGDQEKNWMAA